MNYGNLSAVASCYNDDIEQYTTYYDAIEAILEIPLVPHPQQCKAKMFGLLNYWFTW